MTLITLFLFAHQPDRLLPYEQRRDPVEVPPESLHAHYFDDHLNREVFEKVADKIEATLQERPEKEIATAEIGRFVMAALKDLDEVAYVRFASVYRDFRDIGEFMVELKDLIMAKE